MQKKKKKQQKKKRANLSFTHLLVLDLLSLEAGHVHDLGGAHIDGLHLLDLLDLRGGLLDLPRLLNGNRLHVRLRDHLGDHHSALSSSGPLLHHRVLLINHLESGNRNELLDHDLALLHGGDDLLACRGDLDSSGVGDLNLPRGLRTYTKKRPKMNSIFPSPHTHTHTKEKEEKKTNKGKAGLQ